MQKGHTTCHWEIRSRTWVGHVARIGEKKNAYRILVGKPEGRRLLEMSRRRRVDNIKMGIREIKWDGIYWLMIGTSRGLL
jgi:hypothetical protein